MSLSFEIPVAYKYVILRFIIYEKQFCDYNFIPQKIKAPANHLPIIPSSIQISIREMTNTV